MSMPFYAPVMSECTCSCAYPAPVPVCGGTELLLVYLLCLTPQCGVFSHAYHAPGAPHGGMGEAVPTLAVSQRHAAVEQLSSLCTSMAYG